MFVRPCVHPLAQQATRRTFYHLYDHHMSVSPSSANLLYITDNSILVLRLGDPAFTALVATNTLPEFPAYPTYWDEYTTYVNEYQPDPAGYRIRSTANSQIAASGQQPCVLGIGSNAWLYDTDGLPSNSVNGYLAVAPCYTIPVGAEMDTALDFPKVISILRDDGLIIQSSPFNAYRETYAEGGIRQVVTVNGSSYWLSGMGSNDWGVRYLESGSNATLSISSDSVDAPGYYDTHGIAINNGQLFGTDSTLDTNFGGIYSIGNGLPTTAASSTLLNGFSGASDGIWTFVFENVSSIWAAVVQDPVTNQPGNIEQFVLLAGSWVPQGAIVLDENLPIYSIAGRHEAGPSTGGAQHFVVFAASEKTLYRYDATLASASPLATAVPGQYFRGVALPPSCSYTSSPTPTATPSTTPSASDTACPTFNLVTPLAIDSTVAVVRLGDYAVHDYNVIYSSLGWAYPGTHIGVFIQKFPIAQQH